MANIVQQFGNAVQKTCTKDPLKARRLLRIGYHAKNLQFKFAPGKLNSAARLAARSTTSAMVAPLDHPEEAVMVTLFTPCEMLDYAESEGLPETFCSYHKAFIGAAESGLMPKPRFILSTTLACDANTLTFRRLADHFRVPHFVLDIPYEQTEESVRDVAAQLREMKRFIEDHTGKAALRAAVARSQRSMANFHNYMSLRADKQILDSLTGEMYTGFMFHNLLGSEETERYSEECLRVAEQAPAASGIRLLWMHTNPFWVEPLRKLTDFNPKVQIVGCDMSFEGFVDADSTDPYDAMARRLVFSAFNGPVSHRIARGIEEARRLKADGVVWFCHWGCKHTLGGAQLAKKHFEEADLPCLILDGDGCDHSHGGEGQIATRIEAFVEMLEAEKEANA